MKKPPKEALLQLVRQAMRAGAIDPKTETPLVVWARLTAPGGCRSWFTKKGPGVLARAQNAFRRLTPAQREIAIAHGWFPATWARRTS